MTSSSDPTGPQPPRRPRRRLTLVPGEVVADRWEIVREVAAGGFGTVYEAVHVHTEKRVALKLLHEHMAEDEDTRARFRREVQAPAKIGHPGICDVLDADVDAEGLPFLAMEWLEGETLGARMKRERIPIGELLPLFDEVLDPLAAAHQAGFVHRDLKPDNTFIVTRPDGSRRVCLLDFGLARDHGSETVTQSGTSIGTPRYMAPEQFMSAKHLSPAGDVWAAGVMFYEAATGRPPFTNRSRHALMLDILSNEHVPLRSRVPEASAAVSAVVDRCLAKEAAGRYPDARALRRALREAADAPDPAPLSTARPAAPAAAPAAPARSSRSGGWVVAAFVLLLCLALGALGLFVVVALVLAPSELEGLRWIGAPRTLDEEPPAPSPEDIGESP